MHKENEQRKFNKNFCQKVVKCKSGLMTKEKLKGSIQGWFGYAMWANTYKLRKNLMKVTNEIMNGKLSGNKIIEQDQEEELEVLEAYH